MKHLAIFNGTACAITLAACVPQPKATPPVVVRPAPTSSAAPVQVPVVGNWMDAPQTSGDWSYERNANGSVARFSAGDDKGLFAIACPTGSRRVEMTRFAVQPGNATGITLRTETMSRVLAPHTRAPNTVIAAVPVSDRLLDAMALSKGRFTVEVPGSATLYLPSWAEVTRVIEDCR